MPEWARPVSLRPERLKSFSGVDVASDEAVDILTRLGFGPKFENGVIHGTTPSWRADVETEYCLVEEVLRVKGFDEIPVVPLGRTTSLPAPAINITQRRAAFAKRTLAQRGMMEAVAVLHAWYRCRSLWRRDGRYASRQSDQCGSRRYAPFGPAEPVAAANGTRIGAIPTPVSSRSARPFATTHRRAKTRSRPVCGMAITAHAIGVTPRMAATFTMPKQTRSRCWPPSVPPSTTSRSVPMHRLVSPGTLRHLAARQGGLSLFRRSASESPASSRRPCTGRRVRGLPRPGPTAETEGRQGRRL